MEINRDKSKLRERWTFHWEVMEVLLGGRSPVDLSKLDIDTEAQARDFLRGYGFDPNLPDQARFIHATFVEALYFLEKTLMPGEWQQGVRPPEDIVSCLDPVKLIVWASEKKSNLKRRRLWSCAILRLMHTIAHVDGVHRLSSIDLAREQIIALFENAMFRSKDGRIWLGRESEGVELDRVDWKLKKTRASILLKLLHKPANVAENIYDLIGVRIITKNYADVMMVIKMLAQKNLISFPNANPQRARNSLVDLSSFKKQLEHLEEDINKGQMSPEDFIAELNKLDPEASQVRNRTLNPHSGSSYKSVQITCRHLVRYEDPLLAWTQRVQEFLSEEGDRLLIKEGRLVEGLIRMARDQYQILGEDKNIKIFFPFEVQIFDVQTSELIKRSDGASHEAYRRSQLKAARKRVLFDVLRTLETE